MNHRVTKTARRFFSLRLSVLVALFFVACSSPSDHGESNALTVAYVQFAAAQATRSYTSPNSNTPLAISNFQTQRTPTRLPNTPAPSATRVTPTRTPEPTATTLPLALTLADIFPPRDLAALDLDPARLRTLIATGDIIPARHTDIVIRQHNDNFLYTVDATKALVANADLTVVNLEAPLIQDCPVHDSGFTFCGRPGFIDALQALGADVVTLENNHISNYGRLGVNETVKYLDAAKIECATRDSPAIQDVRGMKFGFLAFNGVGEAIDRKALSAQIRALRPKVDVLAVAFHWGKEYEVLPQAAPGIAPDDPVAIAHLAIDAGADLIIGNHPHHVQPVELYKGKFIMYAHGNFIFDQMWSYDTRVSVVGRYTFYDRTLVKVEYFPTLVQNYARPEFLTGKDAQAILDQIRDASRDLARKLAAQPTPATK